MEKAREALELNKEESEKVSKFNALVPYNQVGFPSFYESFFLHGIKVDRFEPGLVVCTFKVPPHLTDGVGNLSPGAIAALVDVIGGATVISIDPQLSPPITISLSIQHLSKAKIHDELEIISRAVKSEEMYVNTSVSLRNRTTGELVVNCQQLCKPWSRI